MADSTHTTRRWVATLIVLLLLFRFCGWIWNTYSHRQQTQADTALHNKILASMAYDDALRRAQALLNQSDTVAATELLDSLGREPTDQLFGVERQKLRQLRLRLDSVRGARRPPPQPGE
jgi:hypothetical protein